MDSNQINSILFFLILVVMSAFFSSSETAFTSASRIRLQNESDNGDKKATTALGLQKKFDSLLSTILIGNNLVNIASSAIATVFFLELFPTYGATISTVVTTIMLLTFGEITPKLLAKISPESTAKSFAPILKLLMKLFTPVVWIFDKWQKFVKKLSPLADNSAISEEELLSIVDEARLGGSIENEEHQLVRAAIEFDDIDVSTIITPRVDVIGFDINDTDEDIMSLFSRTPYSRLVVYDEEVDNVVGTIHVKDFYRYIHAKNQDQLRFKSFKNLLTKPLFVPPTLPLSDLLAALQQAHTHVGIVIDEYGGMMGIATMEDALEELVGEIWDESDIVRAEIRQLDDKEKYLVQGTYSLDKLFELFGIHDDEEWLSTTVNGFIIEQFEYIPDNNEVLQFKDLEFTVVNAVQQRVNEVVVERISLDDLETENLLEEN